MSESELLLIWGKDVISPSEQPPKTCLQFYDIQEDVWYDPFIFSEDEYKEASLLGVVGSQLFFSAEPKSNENQEIDYKLKAYYSFELATKKITFIDLLAKPGQDNIVKDELIYSIGEMVLCFNTNDNTIKQIGDKFQENFYGNAVICNEYIYGLQPHIVFFIVPKLISFNINTGDRKESDIPDYVDCFHSMVAIDDKIYMTSTKQLDRMIIYTPETENWDVFPVTGPPTISGGQVTLSKGRLLFVDERCLVYEYDFVKKSWGILNRDYNGPICSTSCIQTIKKSSAPNW